MSETNKVRKPAVAGMFYPAQKDTLEREVAVFLENSQREEIVTQIYGIVAPHAGYMYSGGVAARAYRQLIDREFDVIIVISPSHRIYFDEISVYNGQAYRTPLGDIPVDTEVAAEIAGQDPAIVFSDYGHDVDEHALEVQLPFLQHVLGDLKLVPLVMGNQDSHNIDKLALALSRVLANRKPLIVASSDLSHFHSYDKAVLLDKVVLNHVNAFDEVSLLRDLNGGHCEMCGGGPVVATMKASRLLGANKSKVLLYRNSGDVTGDRSQVVGYMAGMFYR